ncbi:hypothetical protein WNZ14_23195 [Hoeflea sp. AS60]
MSDADDLVAFLTAARQQLLRETADSHYLAHYPNFATVSNPQ